MDSSPLVAGAIYRQLRERIISGHYRPGMVLRQQDIAEQFETSRVPLREAFSKLEAEGFLIQRPQRGYAVASLDLSEISEIFELRAIMERHAGQLATRMQRPGDAQAIEALVEDMSLAASNPDGDLGHWCDINRKFHDRLFESCERQRLTHMVQQLRDQVEPYIRMELAHSRDITESARDHVEIISAFRSGDADLVGELCAVHCTRSARRLLGYLQHTGKAI